MRGQNNNVAPLSRDTFNQLDSGLRRNDEVSVNGLFRFNSGNAQNGFTLLELLVVLVIVGITLGAVSFNAMPDERQVLQNDAQRIALLLQMARDEAIVRNHLIAFEAEADRYRFLIRNENSWQPLTGDDLLRERGFKHFPVMLTISPAPVEQSVPLRIIFGREPVDKPFLLTLSTSDARVAIRADGIGHFVVE